MSNAPDEPTPAESMSRIPEEAVGEEAVAERAEEQEEAEQSPDRGSDFVEGDTTH